MIYNRLFLQINLVMFITLTLIAGPGPGGRATSPSMRFHDLLATRAGAEALRLQVRDRQSTREIFPGQSEFMTRLSNELGVLIEAERELEREGYRSDLIERVGQARQAIRERTERSDHGKQFSASALMTQIVESTAQVLRTGQSNEAQRLSEFLNPLREKKASLTGENASIQVARMDRVLTALESYLAPDKISNADLGSVRSIRDAVLLAATEVAASEAANAGGRRRGSDSENVTQASRAEQLNESFDAIVELTVSELALSSQGGVGLGNAATHVQSLVSGMRGNRVEIANCPQCVNPAIVERAANSVVFPALTRAKEELARNRGTSSREIERLFSERPEVNDAVTTEVQKDVVKRFEDALIEEEAQRRNLSIADFRQEVTRNETLRRDLRQKAEEKALAFCGVRPTRVAGANCPLHAAICGRSGMGPYVGRLVMMGVLAASSVPTGR